MTATTLDQATLSAWETRRSLVESSPSARRYKKSGFQVKVDDNPSLWSVNIRDALIDQHGWLAKYQLRVVLKAQDESGNATGFVHVQPTEIPLHAADYGDVGTITIPVIIREMMLAPFDLYNHKGRVKPLTQPEAERVLRVKDVFKTMTGSESNALERSRYQGTGTYLSGNYGPVDQMIGGKMSSVMLDDTLRYLRDTDSIRTASGTGSLLLGSRGLSKHSTWKSLENLIGPAVFEPRKWANPSDISVTTSDVISRIIKQSEALSDTSDEDVAGVYLMKTSENYLASYVYTTPVQGGQVKQSEWHPVPYAHVLAVTGPAKIESVQATPSLWNFNRLTRKCSGPSELIEVFDNGALSDAAEVKSKLSDAKVLNALTESFSNKENATLRGSLTLPGGTSSGVVVAKPTSGVLESKARPLIYISDKGDAYPEFGPSDFVAELGQDGDVVVAGSVPEINRVVSTDMPPAGTETFLVKDSDESDSHSFVVCGLDNAILPTEYGVPAGTEARLIVDEHSSKPDEQSLFCIVPDSAGMDRPVKMTKSDGSTLCMVPRRMVRKVPHVSMMSIAEDTGTPTTETDDNTDQAPVPAESETDNSSTEVKVSSAGQGQWRVFHDAGLRGPAIDREEARLKLVSSGLTDAEIGVVLSKASEANVDHVAVKWSGWPWLKDQERYRLNVTRKEGADQLAKTSSLIAEKVHPSHPLDVGAGDWAAVSWAKLSKSSAAGDVSLDSLLSLGFLTKDNLTRFAAALPSLEESLYRLCALLLASRLGMKEIPEDACESAISSLQEVISGLRAVRTQLLLSIQ